MASEHTLMLPKVRKVELRNFSLYTQEERIEATFNSGVFCLAGANGLGKSTFLAACNYAITGIVADPSQKFDTASDYFKHCKGFSDEYFAGRIREEDREDAEVSVVMSVGNLRYEVTRAVFQHDGLRRLHLEDTEERTVIESSSGTANTSEAERRLKDYESRITRSVGLNYFYQFAFLQHFVFTFDENRRLLLWNPPLLSNALNLAIVGDYEKPRQLVDLRKERDSAHSRTRNYRYDATQIRNEIESLEKRIEEQRDSADGAHEETLTGRYEKLQASLDEARSEAANLNNKLNDATVERVEASAELTSLKSRYEDAFAARNEGTPRIDLHPTVSTSLSDRQCAVCGQSHAEAIERIERKVESEMCPLCESDVPAEDDDADQAVALRKIDEEISLARKQLEEGIAKKNRLEKRLSEAKNELNRAKAAIKEFETENENFLLQRNASREDVTLKGIIDKLHERMEGRLQDTEDERSRRDHLQEQYLELQRELENRYREAEETFVPLFEELAENFIGVDITIRADPDTTIESKGLSLSLEMEGNVRREDYQLSESQRYFLDIALRMSLAEYVSSSESKSTLFIDTPEGSLDAAYEARAGDMFASFTDRDHSIVMTANINTSNLLLRLAERCGSPKMKLQEMTSWTDLSDVQIEESEVFEEALDEIEHALGRVA